MQFRSKQIKFDYFGGNNNRLQMGISTCIEEKNRLTDSTSQLKSEIKLLGEKQKSCEETNISNDEIPPPPKKKENPKKSPKCPKDV